MLSACMFIHNIYEEQEAGRKSAHVLNDIKSIISEHEENNMQTVNNYEKSEKMNTININGYDYIGSIVIPSLNLELPVMSEFDYNRLKIAPCRYYGSVHTNDFIICAHAYKTHFRYITELKQKDKIIFTDVDGQNYVYEVLDIEFLRPDEVSRMIDNEFDLTLYTCTLDGNHRVTVRCNRVLDAI